LCQCGRRFVDWRVVRTGRAALTHEYRSLMIGRCRSRAATYTGDPPLNESKRAWLYVLLESRENNVVDALLGTLQQVFGNPATNLICIRLSLYQAQHTLGNNELDVRRGWTTLTSSQRTIDVWLPKTRAWDGTLWKAAAPEYSRVRTVSRVFVVHINNKCRLITDVPMITAQRPKLNE
jgi:hypothetical protein